jgi:hypothetical protein
MSTVLRAVGLVGAGVVVGLLLRPSPRVASPPPAAASGELIAASTPNVVREYRYVVQSATAPARSALPAAEPAASVESPIGEADIAARLESAFQASSSGPGASTELEAMLRTAFQDPRITGTRVETLECRLNRCRVELEFDDVEADKRVMRQLFVDSDYIEMAMTAPVRVQKPDGKVSATIYLYPRGELAF